MFSVDWPFEDVGEGAQWFDQAEISETDRIKVGRANAIELFKLKLR
jgi:2,3-dihydroxybenzoate decarboxylase